ncbi:MAG: LLM class F420-dependent oxidoreductase [Phototrophicales bacterium]|nr:MAG: LLM class F420-dependent oxidoreductase [Phototrophicales bacterium]
MRIGFQITKFNYPDVHQHLAEIARMVDDGGFYSLWVMDHYFQMEIIGGPDDPMLEAYTTLGYLAGLTKYVKLGVLITGVIYRYPSFLLKQVTTLDVLSNGRAYFGIGAGWYEREARSLGFPFPSTRERFEQLEEILQIAHQLWRGDRTPYHGKHFSLPEPIFNPQPISQPHPPIMVGGEGEKKTLRMVAQYGDACNINMRSIDFVRHKFNILRQHCDTVGRDYSQIEKTLIGVAELSNGTQKIIEACHQYAELGVSQIIFGLSDYHDLKQIEQLAEEIVPAVQAF